MNLGKAQGEPWLSQISRRVKFLQCPNWKKFMSILHLLTTQTWWRNQRFDLSNRSWDDSEEGISEESKGNLKDSLSPIFSFSQNSKILQWILHYLTPQIWWCIQIFYLVILFFGHFSKWSATVSLHVRATISMRFDTARLMVCPTSTV